MKFSWNSKIDRLEQKVNLLIKDELAKLITTNPDKRKYLDDIKSKQENIVNGIMINKTKGKKRLLEFSKYIAADHPIMAKIIATAIIDADDENCVFLRTFLPAKTIHEIQSESKPGEFHELSFLNEKLIE